MEKNVQPLPAAHIAAIGMSRASAHHREALALTAIILIALGLRGWALDGNGYGNEYYSAGVRSMLESWHNFFFNSFDPGGFLSLDKPPVAFWIQVGSAKIFGFGGLSVLLPQVAEGIAAILLLFHLVRRSFDTTAGLLAALFLALMPISVAVDRSSNTESCLVLLLLLASFVLSLATERASGRLLALAMALLGVGFNVKMLAALVLAPLFFLLYLLGAALPLRRRLVHAAAGAAVLGAVSLSWPIAYDVTPAEDRPFAGSSPENSMIELAFDHNGLQRFVRIHRRTAAASAAGDASTASQSPGGGSTAPLARRFENVPAGALRLASPYLAAQIGWLFPLAASLFLVLPWRRPPSPLSPRAQAIFLWAGWVASYGAVFSAAGGIFHAYYLAAMAPAVAAVAAIGATRLWRHYARRDRRRLLLPAVLLATALWQGAVVARFPSTAGHDGWTWLGVALVVAAGLGGAMLLLPSGRRRIGGTAAVALIMVLAIPASWALSSVILPGRVEFPAADGWRPNAADNPATREARERQAEALLAFLDAHQSGERFLVATPDAVAAAPLIIASGKAVLAIGGYSGRDAILTPEEFAALVAQGELRFALVADSDEQQRRRAGPNAALAEWIRQNGSVVDPTLWRDTATAAASEDASAPPRRSRRGRRALNTLELYDLKPDPAASGRDSPS